jgi:WhiB family transcriptional regulator, redox-sensing transcriptional regulator
MRTTTPSTLRAWVDDALCAQTDPEVFFPAKGMASRSAVRVCRACPVRTPCLEEALDAEPAWGLRGGMTPRQRSRERARRAAAENRTDSSAA